MSDRLKSIVAVGLLLLLAGSAFAAGYFTNDFVEDQISAETPGQARPDFTLFWEAWDRVEAHFLGDLPSAQSLTYAAIRGALSVLDDPYTVFVEPVARDHEREVLRGTFGGIGAYVRRLEDNGAILLEPIPGNPAEMAGVLLDDVLVAVDGVEITPEMSVSEVRDMIVGEKGTTVVLTLLHPGETEPVDVEIERDDILLPSVSYRVLSEDNSIGYIQLARFSGQSGNEVRDAIEDLQEQGVESLILDLRHNGGGLLNPAVEISDFFLQDGPILYQVSRDGGEKLFEAEKDTLVPDMPLVILTNGGTASASEIVAGAMQDRQRATVIGETTFGKGSVQLVFDLTDGSSVHITSARWFTPDRQQIDGNGVQPDIPVELTQEAIDNGRDEVLQRAVKFLQEGS